MAGEIGDQPDRGQVHIAAPLDALQPGPGREGRDLLPGTDRGRSRSRVRGGSWGLLGRQRRFRGLPIFVGLRGYGTRDVGWVETLSQFRALGGRRRRLNGKRLLQRCRPTDTL